MKVKLLNSFILLAIYCSLSPLFIRAQQTVYTLSGTVTSTDNPDGLQGGKVSVLETKQNSITDASGYFYFSLPPGNYTLEIRYPGYITYTKKQQLLSNENVEISLIAKVKEVEAIEVKAKIGSRDPSKLGQIELKMKYIKDLPAFLGEVDIVKAIQMLPGVSSVNEGGQGFYVRGGSPDQNLVLLDDVPIYNASHLFGFFSVFNTDAIKSANLIKGTMPANYGGRMSSVLEITANEGNKEQFKMNGGIGLIASRLEIEGPFAKKKGSYMIAGRRTYLDVLMKPFIPKNSPFYGSSYFFYDLNMKVNYQIGTKDKIQFASYYGIDQFDYVNKTDAFNVTIPWGNAVTSFKWIHNFNSKHFLNATTYWTKYDFTFGSNQTDFSIALKSGISDIGQKINFTYLYNAKHKFQYGLEYIHHTFTPSSLSAKQGDTPLNTGVATKLFSHETSFYFTDEYQLNEKLNFQTGLRYSMFHFVGPFTRLNHDAVDNVTSKTEYRKNELISWYGGFEPRASIKYQFTNLGTIKAGYSFNYQYIHLTSLSALSLPTDIWFPTTDIAKPQQGYQLTLGYFKNFNENSLETSVELYYKGIKNLVEYKPGALPSENITDNVDNLLVFGTGKSYGIEFFVRKNIGKFYGWIGYTLAKTERFFPEIQTTPFPAKYDRRHDLSIVGTYKKSERVTFGLSYVYATGNTLTLPSSWYLHEQSLLFNYNKRNSTRMPNYHRLDLSVTIYDKATKIKHNKETGNEETITKRYRSNWNFSIYNVYNQANPFFLYLDGNGVLLKGNFKLTVKQVTLFPIIPSVTWNFTF